MDIEIIGHHTSLSASGWSSSYECWVVRLIPHLKIEGTHPNKDPRRQKVKNTTRQDTKKKASTGWEASLSRPHIRVSKTIRRAKISPRGTVCPTRKMTK